MSPAAVVAVTRLALDVMDRLADQDLDSMTPATADLARLLIPHVADLRQINAEATREMQGLAPRLLAEPYPAPG